jgi:hypothetical protein
MSLLLTSRSSSDPDGLLDCWHCGKVPFSRTCIPGVSPLGIVGWKGTHDPRYACYL